MIFLPSIGDYIDVDAYASALAYAELLRRRGDPAKARIALAPNYSVPETLRLKAQENPEAEISADDTAIILDVSNPEAISQVVAEKQIRELIDHHVGFEKFWQEKLGERAQILPIGAVATVIAEKWQAAGENVPPEFAKLLLAAILDNTLNFNATITTTRDHVAAEKLAQTLETSVADFAAWYFGLTSASVLGDLRSALLNDMKPGGHNLAFAQITLWDAAQILPRQAEIAAIMNAVSAKWIVNVICIGERRNYLCASAADVAEDFAQLLNLQKQGDWLVSDQLFLRKEILAKMQNAAK